MATLSDARIADLIAPYLASTSHLASQSGGLVAQLSVYLDLLLRWNARTNLTAIREPEEIVRRHFGEGLFTAAQLQPLLAPGASVMDFGSGAGFPGLPIQLFLPQVHVTLAESQGKKAAFLREAVRTLGLQTEVWAGRVESMAQGRVFDCVALRAVDQMGAALVEAHKRVAPGGFLTALGGEGLQAEVPGAVRHPMSGAGSSFLYLQRFAAAVE